MDQDPTTHHCLSCERPETAVPLVSLRYAGQAAWICSQCLPTLIHHPEKLTGRLAGAEQLAPAPPLE
jgi:hypothetical protein